MQTRMPIRSSVLSLIPWHYDVRRRTDFGRLPAMRSGRMFLSCCFLAFPPFASVAIPARICSSYPTLANLPSTLCHWKHLFLSLLSVNVGFRPFCRLLTTPSMTSIHLAVAFMADVVVTRFLFCFLRMPHRSACLYAWPNPYVRQAPQAWPHEWTLLVFLTGCGIGGYTAGIL